MTYAGGTVRAVPVRRAVAMFAMCITEARPAVLVIFLMRFLAGSTLATERIGGTAAKRIVIGGLSWELAILFVYLLNGVMDVHEDRVNASRRPIATGALPARAAGRVAWSAAVVSVAGAVTLGLRFTAALVAILAVGYLYSAPPLYLKRRAVGTAAVGALLGLLTYYAGHVASGDGGAGRALPTFAVVMSLWMALVGAPAKDLPDVVGDAAAGRRTLAVLVEESWLRPLMSATALGLAAAFLALARGTPVLLAPALTVLAGSAGVAALCLSRVSQGGRSRRRRPYRAFMVTQYSAHITALTGVTILS